MVVTLEEERMALDEVPAVDPLLFGPGSEEETSVGATSVSSPQFGELCNNIN